MDVKSLVKLVQVVLTVLLVYLAKQVVKQDVLTVLPVSILRLVV